MEKVLLDDLIIYIGETTVYEHSPGLLYYLVGKVLADDQARYIGECSL